jgi:hypothetical protein
MWGWVKKAAKKVWHGVKKVAKKVWHGVRGTISYLAHAVYLVIARIVGIPELILSLIGLRWRKYMEVSVIILSNANRKPVADIAEVEAVVEEAKRVFRQQCNIRLRQPSVYDSIVRNHEGGNPAYVLNPKCDQGAFKHVLTRVGAWYDKERANGGVTIFVVEDVQDKTGCHIGPFAEWGYIDPNALRDGPGVPTAGRALTLAHELGHSCQLTHRDRRNNLMVAGPGRRTAHLDRWQRAWVRSSYRVHYFSAGGR